MLTANVGMVLSQFDMQIIITVLGTEKAGYYANYLSLIGIPFIIITPAINFLFPVVSRIAGQNNIKQLQKVKYAFHNIFAPLAVSLSVFFFVFSLPLSTLLFGQKFAVSGEVLLYSVPFLVFNFLLQTNFQLLSATGRIRRRAKILFYGLIVNVSLICLSLFVLRLGLDGVSASVGIAWILIWYLSERETREIEAKFEWGVFMKNIAVSALL